MSVFSVFAGPRRSETDLELRNKWSVLFESSKDFLILHNFRFVTRKYLFHSGDARDSCEVLFLTNKCSILNGSL